MSGSHEFTWCIDTGAQVSVMPDHVYRPYFGTLQHPDRQLVGPGDHLLDVKGFTYMKLTSGKTSIREKVRADLLIGMTFRVKTDHKPLVPLFSSKLIDELPIRIQRFRMRLMRFCFDIVHVPGKELYTADTLSRAPLPSTKSPVDDLIFEAEAYVIAGLLTLLASD